MTPMLHGSPYIPEVVIGESACNSVFNLLARFAVVAKPVFGVFVFGEQAQFKNLFTLVAGFGRYFAGRYHKLLYGFGLGVGIAPQCDRRRFYAKNLSKGQTISLKLAIDRIAEMLHKSSQVKWLSKFWSKKQESVATPTRQPSAPQDPSWTDEDTIALIRFMASTTGLRLREKSRAMRFACMENSSADTFHTAHSAGVSHGLNEYEKWLMSLSTIRISGETAVPVSNNTADAHQDEDALLTQFSP